jgi:hypothetical protein
MDTSTEEEDIEEVPKALLQRRPYVFNPNRLITKDVGICNVGLCRGDPFEFLEKPGGYYPVSERANHLVRKRDGRVFKYDETEMHLRVQEWQSEYGHLIRDAEMYLFEGQLSFETGHEFERGCLLFQTAEVSVMQTLKSYGVWNGVVGIENPKEWKRLFKIPSSPKNLSKREQHEFQKKEDAKAYIKRFGQERYNAYVKLYGIKVDDVIDAELFWVFAAENYDTLLKRFRYQSSHVWVYNHDKDVISAKDRIGYDLGKGLLVEDEDIKKFVLKSHELAMAWNQLEAVTARRKRKW